MKAIVQTGERSVEVQQRERPTVGPNQVLIEVHSAGVCGSDAHAYTCEEGYEWIPIPRIMGHEYAGTVVEVGADVTEFSEGDHVLEEPVRSCGTCFQCKNEQSNVCQNFSIRGMHRDGAYTEYVAVDEPSVHRLPDTVPLEEAAIAEPTSVAARAVFAQSSVSPGDNVLVEGPGPIGVLSAVVADSAGANVLVSGLGKDSEYRLPMLEGMDIETVDIEADPLDDRTESFTDGVGFDVVFDTTGHRTGVEVAVEQVRKGGEVVVVGLPGGSSDLFMTPVVRGEITVGTSYGSKWKDFERAIRLMESGAIDVDPIVDHSYDVDDPRAAFESFLRSETCKPLFTFA